MSEKRAPSADYSISWYELRLLINGHINRLFIDETSLRQIITALTDEKIVDIKRVRYIGDTDGNDPVADPEDLAGSPENQEEGESNA